VIKISCAMAIIGASAPASLAAVTLHDAGSGDELELSWTPAQESDVVGYTVYIGTGTGRYDTSMTTPSTSFRIQGLAEGTRYFVGVSAYDNSGLEGPIIERSEIPYLNPRPPAGLADHPKRHSIELGWSPNAELDIAGYNVYRSTEPSASGTRLNDVPLADTLYSDANVSDGVMYYYSITAVDNLQHESTHGQTTRSRVLSLNQGVAIVDETKGGTGTTPGSPSDAQVDAFYYSIMPDFHADVINADSLGTVKLADIDAYSSILWHGDDLADRSPEVKSADALRDYMSAGGKLLITGYRPASGFIGTSSTNLDFGPGDFVHDWLGIAHESYYPFGKCNGALPLAPGYPPLTIDSAKSSATSKYHIVGVEVDLPAPSSIAIYGYGTAYDTATAAGKPKGSPIGTEYISSGHSAVVLAIPLYFVRFQDARDFVRHVLVDRFSETTGIPVQDAAMPAGFALEQNYPNPFNPMTEIQFTIVNRQWTIVKVFDVLGREIATLVDGMKSPGRHSITFDGSGLASGVYIYRLQVTPSGGGAAGASVASRKMLLVR